MLEMNLNNESQRCRKVEIVGRGNTVGKGM